MIADVVIGLGVMTVLLVILIVLGIIYLARRI